MKLRKALTLATIGVTVFIATTGADCSGSQGPIDPEPSDFVDLTVTLNNQSSERIHIFRDVLETFGAQNRLEPGTTGVTYAFDVEIGDDVNWVAGRDGVPFDHVACIAPVGTAPFAGAKSRPNVALVWAGDNLSRSGWVQEN